MASLPLCWLQKHATAFAVKKGGVIMQFNEQSMHSHMSCNHIWLRIWNCELATYIAS